LNVWPEWPDTVNSKAVAREWLWFVGCLAVAVAVVTLWADPPDPVSAVAVAVLLAVALYGVSGFTRVTWWAIRRLSQP
jgi:hypothetical protein